ncbi:DNA-3-methyladenine glycosylase [Paenisporosarcina sp. TG20]|uniref:DNA-3-methyladenine glycosylase 2 n=1 Tax=Paenisporosarcina sp. TG20 TaxID=1211706 RepID=UPI00031EF2F5|nr:DNA-3-methyladenine glycosylase [Paenisporosarcina sp. TG20]
MGEYLDVFTPSEFNFEECLVFLGRSEQENLHQIKDGGITKLINVNEKLILFKITHANQHLRIVFLGGTPSKKGRENVAANVEEWFDLQTDLLSFYEMASQDQVLKEVVKKHYGLRVMCIPDLFEALTWAVMGQQINLSFAYTLKKRFVENYGESLIFNKETYWTFPSYQKIATITVDDLRKLQFTNRKAEYIIGIAVAMTKGHLLKEKLLQESDMKKVEKSLMAIRGIGAWSANYVMMKCLRCTSAFPLADVGLHNALKTQLGLDQKPTLKEIEDLSKNWEGWQGYATFYLWRTLYE